MAITIKLRRTSNQLSTVTEIPKQGEAVYGLTDKQLVIGDGSTQVKNLPRFYAKTWQGDIIAATYGGTGNNSGYIRAGLASSTTAGSRSTAEGYSTQPTGSYSHAEGYYTTASGNSSHAENYHTTASGSYSSAAGLQTISNHKSQYVFGEYNIQDPSSSSTTSRGTYVEIVGNGTSSTRSNARTLDWNGNEILAGKLTVGQGPVNNMDVATKLYVDNGLATKQESLPSSSTTNQSLVSISNGFQWKNINTTLQSSTAATSSTAQKLKVTVLGVASSELELSKASTSLYGVTKLSSTVSSTEEGLAATPKGVQAAINELDVNSVGGSGKYISAISQLNGKISATASNTTVTNVITAGTTAGPTLTTTVNGLASTVTIPSASSTASGVVTTGNQTFKGIKTFYNEGTTSEDVAAAIKFSNKDTTTGQTYSKAGIFAYQDHAASTYGLNMVIVPGGNLLLGSGESSTSLYDALKSDWSAAGDEVTLISADTSIYLYANAQSIGNRVGVKIDTSGAMVPVKAEATYDNVLNIGASNNKWKTVYATTFDGNATSATLAASATKLQTGRTLKVNLASTSASTAFNGTANITDIGVSGTLPVSNGGTGLTSSPSMLTNLASTSAQNVLQSSPRPGVTGTLPVSNGGTGASSFSTNNLVLSNTSTTGALKTLTGGSGGKVLMSTGANSVPVWADIVSNFLSSPDLDSQYLWDIIQTKSGSYNALTRDLSDYWISTSKKYVHCFTTCTGASATTVTLGGTYSSGTVSDSTSVNATKYFYMSTSSTKPTSAVSVDDVYYTPNGTQVQISYKSGDSTKYIRVHAYKVYCLSNAGVSIETVIGSSNQYTQAKTSTSVTLNRGTLRQILLGGRTGCYVGNGSSTLNLSLSWIPRVLLISGYVSRSSRTISAMFDLHNVSANSYNPVQAMSYAPPSSSSYADQSNFEPTWYIVSSKIRGITLSSAGDLNLSGVVYQYFAVT